MMRLAGTFRLKIGVAGGRKLVDQLARGRAAVEDARVGFFQDHHAAALDARVVGSTAAVTKLAKPMLVMKRPRFSTCSIGSSPPSPFGDLHLAAQHAGLDADVGQIGSVRQNAPRQGLRSSPGCAGAHRLM
jgi:hypothetical protein